MRGPPLSRRDLRPGALFSTRSNTAQRLTGCPMLGWSRMPKLGTDLRLHRATMDDFEIIANLATAYDPDDPRDPAMVRYSWEAAPADDRVVRMLAERNGSRVGYFAAGHEPWSDENRFGWIRAVLHPDHWTEARFLELVGAAEEWQQSEGASTGVIRLRERFGDEIAILERSGYREERRAKNWELNLLKNRDRLLASAVRSRAKMNELGVQMITLDRDTDPDRMTKLYDLTNATERDIPTTIPIRTLPFDDWHRRWFGDPSIRADRVWIARQGDDVVGISMIGYPPQRGVPSTAFTGTAPGVRGRGLARALKYETVAQAISLGAERIRTSNDGENAPILHLNAEMGYQPIDPVIELHRDLAS